MLLNMAFGPKRQQMARELSIYAVHDDALQLLQSLELQGPLQYVLGGAFDTPDSPVHAAAADIPDLGRTRFADISTSDRYMIFRPPVDVVRREVAQNNGKVLYFVDPWKNPQCILFTCGGLFRTRKKRCVIGGQIFTTYKDGPVLNLYRDFERKVKKQFARVKAPVGTVYVGPCAMELLKEGFRFTDSLFHTDTDMDVKYQHFQASGRQRPAESAGADVIVKSVSKGKSGRTNG